MNILLVGGGGREHAMAWKIAQSPLVKKLYCAPGNAGMAAIAACIPIAVDDLTALQNFALEKSIDLVVIGPEGPLVAGLSDQLQTQGIAVFGPSQAAAAIEGSKVFMKDLFARHDIPTAPYQSFRDPDQALAYIRTQGAPIVVKASGLAAGKGAIVCHTLAEAEQAIDHIMVARLFGQAGDEVVIEGFLQGEELSFLALVDGKNLLPLAGCQDHKAVGEGDAGANTGGMGAYSPAPVLTPALQEKVMAEVMIPVVRAMAKEGRPFRGVLYAGLMIDQGKIRVLEFNARFGDPETQPLMMRMRSDLVPFLLACAQGSLHGMAIDWDPRPALCVVMAAGGYPGNYNKGNPISGLEQVGHTADVQVFHAGTLLQDGQCVTAGGRVLGVTALGKTIAKAQEHAYAAVQSITWQGVYYRRDIGYRAIDREKRMNDTPLVGILMGSDSDWEVMQEAASVLRQLAIPFEMTVSSAHRTPERTHEYATSAVQRGLKVLIAGAGAAAHLAGVVAASTPLPVIGVPLSATDLHGLDALLATVQMPGGIPVATMAIGKSGARNAALFSARILALSDPELAKKLSQFNQNMTKSVQDKDASLQQRLQTFMAS